MIKHMGSPGHLFKTQLMLVRILCFRYCAPHIIGDVLLFFHSFPFQLLSKPKDKYLVVAEE